mmetsp:Transcript_100742/g.184505  ORF Transcript_100742/g.184505 Transcript_100742/m.184505 type:complete len:828 (+) Transcript_100742:129-2612(+)
MPFCGLRCGLRDLFPDLEVPKMVIIPNLRLSVMYTILTAGMFTALLLRFFLTTQYYMEIEIGQDIWTMMSMKNMNNYTLMRDVYELFLNHKICRQPEVFEFWFGEAESVTPDDSLKFGNYSCMEPCPPGQFGSECVGPYSMALPYSNSGLMNSWILTTQVSRRQYNLLGEEIWSSNGFVPSVSGLAIELNFGFNVMLPNVFGNYPANRNKAKVIKGANRVYGDSSDAELKITTVVLNSDGGVDQKIEFGNKVWFSLPKMLELAGNQDWLDSFATEAGKNLMPNHAHDSPLARLAGGELLIHLDCFDDDRLEVGDELDISGYICYVQLEFGQRSWLKAHSVYHTLEGFQSTDFFGLHVVVVPGGSFHRLDVNNIVLQIAFCIVMMSVPKKIMLIVMLYFLGHLSKIYKRVIYETFPLRQMVAGMITRMISSTSMFNMLCDVEGNDGEAWSGGISKASVKSRLQTVLEHRHVGISPDDLERCVNFCFLMLYQGQKDNEDVDERDRSTWEEVITLDGFCNASCSVERISMENVIALFDWSRPRSRLEKMFTPDDLQKDRLEAALWRHNLKVSETAEVSNASKRHFKLSLMEKKEDEQGALNLEALSIERQVESQVRKQEVSIARLKDRQDEAKGKMLDRLSGLDEELKKALDQLHHLQETEGLKFMQSTNDMFGEGGQSEAATTSPVMPSSTDPPTLSQQNGFPAAVATMPAAKRAVAKSSSSSSSDVPPPLPERPERSRLSPPPAFKEAVAAAAGHGVSANSISSRSTAPATKAANLTACGPGVVSLYHYSNTPEPASVGPESREGRGAPRGAPPESHMSGSEGESELL